MGNNVCTNCLCGTSNVEARHQKFQQAALKGRLIQICERYANQAEQSKLMNDSPSTDSYVEFINSKLCLDIILHQENRREKHLFSSTVSSQIEMKWYKQASTIKNLIINSEVPTLETSISQTIISDLQANINNIFTLILDSHLNFMEKIIKQQAKNIQEQLQQISPDKCSQDDGFIDYIDGLESPTQDLITSLRTSPQKSKTFVSTTGYKAKHFTLIFQHTKIQVIRLLVHLIVALFALLRVYIVNKYKNLLKIYYSSGLRDLQSLSTTLQSIIQQFLFCNGSIVKHMMTPLLKRFYEEQVDEFCMAIRQSEEKIIPKLNSSLHPKKFDFKEFTISEEYLKINSMFNIPQSYNSPIFSPTKGSPLPRNRSSVKWMQNDSVGNESGFYFQTKEYNIEIMKIAINRGEVVSQQNEVPYNQTFEVLRQIAQEPKYYMKCHLINKLDQLIINIYMFQRPANQHQKCMDVINTEDNKLEILMFILHKFQKQYEGQFCLKKDFLNHVRFMIDYDEVVHYQVKNLFNQSYVRFFSILELVVNAQFELNE